jgi:hypothetical protein
MAKKKTYKKGDKVRLGYYDGGGVIEDDVIAKTTPPAGPVASTGSIPYAAMGNMAAAGVEEFVPAKTENAKVGKSVGKGALKGAGQGAAIGTMIAPGIGTAIGAGAGALVGAGVNFAKAKKEQKVARELNVRSIEEERAQLMASEGLTGGRPNTETFGLDYAEGGKIKGAGTAKSDSIEAEIPEGSFIVPAENAKKAVMLRAKYLGGDTEKKAKLKSGGTAVKVSNGEHMFSPEEAQYLKSQGVDLNKLAPNAEPGRELAEGGDVPNSTRMKYEKKAHEELKNKVGRSQSENDLLAYYNLIEKTQQKKQYEKELSDAKAKKDFSAIDRAQKKVDANKLEVEKIKNNLGKEGYDRAMVRREQLIGSEINALKKESEELNKKGPKITSAETARLNEINKELKQIEASPVKEKPKTEKASDVNSDAWKATLGKDNTKVDPVQPKTTTTPVSTTPKNTPGAGAAKTVAKKNTAAPVVKQPEKEMTWDDMMNGKLATGPRAEEIEGNEIIEPTERQKQVLQAGSPGGAEAISEQKKNDLLKKQSEIDAETAMQNSIDVGNKNKNIPKVATNPDAATGSNVFNSLGGATGAIAAAQAGLGAYNLIKDGKRPVDRISDEFNNAVEEAKLDAKTGMDATERSIASREIEANRIARVNAGDASGVSVAARVAADKSAANNASDSQIDLSAASERLRLQKRQMAYSLITQKEKMKRMHFEDKMNAFNQNQMAGAQLLGAGIDNYVGEMRYKKDRENALEVAKASNPTYNV